MKLSDKILITLSVVILLALIVGAAMLQQKEQDEAQRLCHPFRVKHSFEDPDSHKTRAVCASSPSGSDELR